MCLARLPVQFRFLAIIPFMFAISGDESELRFCWSFIGSETHFEASKFSRIPFRITFKFETRIGRPFAFCVANSCPFQRDFTCGFVPFVASTIARIMLEWGKCDFRERVAGHRQSSSRRQRNDIPLWVNGSVTFSIVPQSPLVFKVGL
jgi:hypothetical protein